MSASTAFSVYSGYSNSQRERRGSLAPWHCRGNLQYARLLG